LALHTKEHHAASAVPDQTGEDVTPWPLCPNNSAPNKRVAFV
jgi:hypothetical protein